MFLKNPLAIIKTLPKDLDFIICGPTAAKILGLTSVTSKVFVYTEKPYNLDKEVIAIVTDSLSDIACTGNTLKRTTPEKTISDILEMKSTFKFDIQIPIETLANYMIDCQEGRRCISELESFLQANGTYESYLELKDRAEEWVDYGA